MDKLRPYQKLASQFQISEESAKYFLNHVQKSFKTEKPPHLLILEFIESQKMEFLLTPYETAAIMNETGHGQMTWSPRRPSSWMRRMIFPIGMIDLPYTS